MRLKVTPFGKGEISFNVKGDVSVEELIEYVKIKLDGILDYNVNSYLDKKENIQIYEFECLEENVWYTVTVTGKNVKIMAENLFKEDDPAIIYKAQQIVNSFKDFKSYFKGRKIGFGKFRLHTDVYNEEEKKDKVPFEI